ncbi:hypothetical protein HRW12_00010 [Streptomyces lunaelactis]|uniref:hypothetical protein n=1 Tax=Streptomyces lunaelactis TaxID=1535768 RepID=UPI001584F87B|nr:hypothetical protein [Streptomyces lunaelactis]NUK32180.1 hypothetical protein [Streptomyces lunaelactis]NUK44963.1 hypothetical protein [Streptomyces lunaelactis]
MFTIKADALSAILDKVAPHRPSGPDMDHLDMVVLDCTRNWLHAVAGGERTLAVARTTVAGTYWTAPLAYDDASALRGWLDSSDHVLVEHILEDGRQLLRFTEGTAQITVPVATYVAELPWRTLLRAEARPPSYARGPVRLCAEDLALWEHAGEEVEVRHAAGRAALVVTAGTDFIGFQMPRPGHRSENPLDGWATSVRSRHFLYEDTPYEVGAVYVDMLGVLWRVAARPAPGEEPVVVSADRSGVVLPLAVVLKAGGHLLRLPV